MSDNKEKRSEVNRDFDWGPPGNSVFDNVKEWLVYLIFIILLAAGGWFLLDVNSQKVSEAKRIVSAPSSKPATIEQKLPEVVVAKEPGRFQVQLGAFADRKSATEAFDALKAQNYSPILSEPDSQYEIYRVSVGPFSSETEAEETAEKLNSLDFHCFVIESP